MNFFDQQASRRWQSAFLLVSFLLVLLCLGVLIHIVIAALALALGQGGSFAHPSKPALAMIVLVWLTMIAGCFFRFLDVKAGGATLAARFGAVQASELPYDEKQQQLMNVVAEVSIASSTAQPDVYVMRRENSINAFVLGNRATRPAVVLTDGALKAFNREQLQAVVAHEFGHLANGDLPLNMRLLVVMGGLLAIDEVGRLMIARRVTDSVHPGMIIGYLVCSLGKIGVLAGQLITSAFSRQREFLADASAVQYTRNAFALASALDLVSEQDHQPALHGVYARELSHLCFQSGKTKRWLGRLLATHPDLSRRIEAIEPHYTVKKRKALLAKAFSLSSNSPLSQGSAISQGGPMLTPFDSSIVTVDSDSVLAYEGSSDAQMISSVLSDRIVLMLPDKTSCSAALFALFAHDNPRLQQDNFSHLISHSSEQFTAKVRMVMELIPDELAKNQLGIIVHVTQVLRKKMSVQQRVDLIFKLEQYLSKNENYHLMDYARVQLLRRKLDIEFPVIKAIVDHANSSAKARKVKSLDRMGSEFALLLSLMVESSGASPKDLDAQFQRVLKCYTQDSYPRRSANESGIIEELEAAFQTLYIQPEPIRHAFIQHCVEIMQHDGFLMPTERALLELFAASLGCEDKIAA